MKEEEEYLNNNGHFSHLVYGGQSYDEACSFLFLTSGNIFSRI